MELEKIEFDERGLVPAVVQDHETGEILMLAYMNAESLARTLQTGEAWFWDRSRDALWHKGETSGNGQQVVDLRLDCDGASVVVRVRAGEPACHTGERSCFSRPLAGAPPARVVASPRPPATEPQLAVVDMKSMELGILLHDLYTLIRLREAERPEKSYTTYLFNSGLDKILKKIGEEATETVIAAKNGSTRELTSEMADLLYHLLVLMVERGLGLDDICRELAERAGKTADPKRGAAMREG
jgi:phosphoribosyl-AMP cyclohydrolase / phosphoribosyl-ATP pyrophosphohydrolase